MSHDQDFKAGDIVKWQEGSTWHRFDVWGKVTAITASGTLTVNRLDRSSEVETVRKGKYGYKCALVSEHEIQVRRWHNALPETKHIDVGLGLPPYRDDHIRISMSHAKLSMKLLDEAEADL